MRSPLMTNFFSSKTLGGLALTGHKRLARRAKMLLMTIMIAVIVVEPDLVIDGVTAATPPPKPPAPKLVLTSSTAIVNNKIRLLAGQTLTIDLIAADPKGYTNVKAGILDNGVITVDSNSLSQLPGASITEVGGDPAHTLFTWTPQADDALTKPMVVLKFVAVNTHLKTKRTQAITVTIDDNVAPTFNETTTPPQQTITAGILSKILVAANADPDNDAVVITANDLPAGAVLSKTVKNKQGVWVATLSWKPGFEMGGTDMPVTFTAQDDELNPAQTTYPVTFSVVDVTSPSFAASMPGVQNAVGGKKLAFKVIVNPDPHSQTVSISATGLPAGAILSKPSKVKGQWVAIMSWKPSAALAGSSFPVTFTAQDTRPGAVPVLFDVTFNVTAN